MKSYLVYITTNIINGKKYIGSHINTNPKDNYLGSGVNLLKAIKKYGKGNFIREILGRTSNEEEMKMLEEYYIEYYYAFSSPLFYNATKYAKGITKYPEWAKKKVSKINKGHKYNLGRVMSQETKDKISLSNKGKPFSKKRKAKMKKPIIQLDLEGNYVREYNSLGLAAKVVGVDYGGLSKVANGKQKTSGGYKWKWKNK